MFSSARFARSSLSARRAWIEIHIAPGTSVFRGVALRKESVDRNICMKEVLPWVLVALRKESVDRNLCDVSLDYKEVLSLSARRAWIEIFVPFDVIRPAIVALRKESVDRNSCFLVGCIDRTMSLSARRAWIEIYRCRCARYSRYVALRKESVDRNRRYCRAGG